MMKYKGFTLIEMVAVIVLLGVISVGVTSFLRFGTQAYVDVTARDELIASGRFAIERLNRELRAALPNSVRINTITIGGVSSGQCIEFRPTRASAVYLDVPVAPEALANKVELIKFEDSEFTTDLEAVVYPLNPDDAYADTGSDKIRSISALTNSGSIWELTLASTTHFEEDSPTRRIYFVDRAVSYCVIGGEPTLNDAPNGLHELRRYEGYSRTADGIPSMLAAGALMAERLTFDDVNLPFDVVDATRTRNSVITARLTYRRNSENVAFNNEVQVINVP